MRLTFFFAIFLTVGNDRLLAQFDSITLSRCSIEQQWYNGNWPDSLKANTFQHYIYDEKTIFNSGSKKGSTVAWKKLSPLLAEINANGTDDISKCFIPRHSINFYRDGRLVRYLLVCFECDGVRLSDGPRHPFIKSVSKREDQMKKLKEVFEGML